MDTVPQARLETLQALKRRFDESTEDAPTAFEVLVKDARNRGVRDPRRMVIQVLAELAERSNMTPAMIKDAPMLELLQEAATLMSRKVSYGTKPGTSDGPTGGRGA